MAHILNLGYVSGGVPVFFKRKNRQQKVHVSLNGARAVRAPGPKLWTYIIDDRNTAAMKPARQTQIEIGPVNQNRGNGFSFFRGPFQLAKGTPEFWQRAANFPQPEYCQLVRFHDWHDAGFSHLYSGGA